jgi:hypothetical protein
VFILKDFKFNDFGSVHSRGLTDVFSGSADSKGLSEWRRVTGGLAAMMMIAVFHG